MPAITTMTVSQIQARLAELDEAQAEFDKRNFDAELSHALMGGADIDALEADHLEAERVARRIRVERSALETALPDAQSREGSDTLDGMAKDHAKLQKRAEKARDAVVEAWTALDAALGEWSEVRGEAVEMTQQASKVAIKSGAALPKQLGTFQSAKLTDVHIDMRGAPTRLGNTTATMTTNAGLAGVRLD